MRFLCLKYHRSKPSVSSLRTPGGRLAPVAALRGFTLVEMLVALTLFSFVLLAAVGSLVSIIDANRKARSQKVVMNNLNAALDSMTRSIREGNEHLILDPGPDSGSTLDFVTENGDPSNVEDHIRFELVDGRIMRTVGMDSSMALTAGEVWVEGLTFERITHGAAGEQFKVLLTIKAAAGEGERIESTFDIQTLVSARYEPQLLPVGGSDVPENPICPFNAVEPGRYIVNMELQKGWGTYLCGIGRCNSGLGWNSSPAPLTEDDKPPYDFLAPVPPGTYRVAIVAWDYHCDNTGFCEGSQRFEDFYLELLDAGGQVVATTNSTEDLQTFVNQEIFITDEELEITSEVHSAIAYSTNRGAGGSVVPVCAALDAVEGTSYDITPGVYTP